MDITWLNLIVIVLCSAFFCTISVIFVQVLSLWLGNVPGCVPFLAILWLINAAAFWFGVPSVRAETNWQIALIAYVLDSTSQIIAIPVAMWSLTVIQFLLVPIEASLAKRGVHGFSFVATTLLPFPAAFLVVYLGAYLLKDWAMSTALWLVGNDLLALLGVDFYLQTVVGMILAVIFLSMLVLALFAAAKLNPRHTTTANSAFAFVFPVPFAFAGTLAVLFHSRDGLLRLSVALAVPLGAFAAIIAELIFVGIYLWLKGKFTSSFAKERHTLDVALAPLWILGMFYLSFRASGLAVAIAHSSFFDALIARGGSIVTTLWYWLANVTSIITLWEFVRKLFTKGRTDEDTVRRMLVEVLRGSMQQQRK